MFSGSDVVDFGSGGWGDGKVWTFLEQELLCPGTSKWFVGEVLDPYFSFFHHLVSWRL